MTESEERYVHFASCIEWLNEAWNLLCTLRSERDNRLLGTAFRFALVLYAKPYRESRGNTKRKHRLDSSLVPAKYLALHEELLAERDTLHAHTDLTVMDAMLTVKAFQGVPVAMMVRNHIDPTSSFARLEEIVSLIESSLDNMYEEAKRIEAGRSPTAA